jgi:nucleoside 2-deoxyribosyltransferase
LSTFRVYLAGPITGCTYEGATDWREAFKAKVSEMSNGRIECLSPMRGKREYLQHVAAIEDNYGDIDFMASGQAITTRDRFDCKRSDAVIFNFLGAARVSIGTCIELGWADDGIKPCILVMEKPAVDLSVSPQFERKVDRNLHEHSMVRYVTNLHVDNLDDAADALCRIFLP